VARAIALYEESATLNRNVGYMPGVAESIERFALIAHDMEQPERAARLFGVAEALRTAIGAPLPPADSNAYDRTITNARAVLGADAFAAAWAAGAAGALEDALVEAFEGMSDEQ